MQITEKFLKDLKLPERGSKVLYEGGHVPGFGIRVTSAGAIAFILSYRFNGRAYQRKVARWPESTPTEARNKAFELRKDISKGTDPFASENDQHTMTELADDYFTEYADAQKRPGSLRNDHSILRNHILPRLGRYRVSAVTHRDVQALHSSLRNTKVEANRVMALLSKMFALAVDWGWRADNPTAGIKKYHETPRKDWLTLAQLVSLGRALDEYRDQEAADAIRLLILTGARFSEVVRAEWKQFDLAAGTWTKPAHTTKTNTIETVPLNPNAIEILVRLAEHRRSQYIFPGEKQGPRATLRKPWEQVCRVAGLSTEYQKKGKRKLLTRYKPMFRVYDLRHSFAAHLASSGLSLHIVGRLMGHTRPETTQRYAHLNDKALRDATNVFGNLYQPAKRKLLR